MLLETNDLLTPKEAAVMCNTTRKSVYEWIASGKLPTITIGGLMFVMAGEAEKHIKGKRHVKSRRPRA